MRVWGFRILVKEFNLHNTETVLFTIDPYYGNLNSVTRTQGLHKDLGLGISLHVSTLKQTHCRASQLQTPNIEAPII